MGEKLLLAAVKPVLMGEGPRFFDVFCALNKIGYKARLRILAVETDPQTMVPLRYAVDIIDEVGENRNIQGEVARPSWTGNYGLTLGDFLRSPWEPVSGE